ncbi:dihydroorotate dehydrogenase [Halalkalibacter kiskunsagensis]|uniref:Dihydroorotate dehydrogenase n=1 Tax=Halalkalibacter kiskunsagensis TaxID=1548599 RepID=A0ABV6KJC6_9BACI
MPDWSYHALFKPLLSRLPANMSREFIHKNMNRIASIPGGTHVINFLGREESSKRLEKKIDPLYFSNSIGFSGKLDPHLSGTQAFANLGFGFIEIGPVTMQTQEKAVPPRINHSTNQITFHENYESIGLAQTIQKIKHRNITHPLFIRLTGTMDEQLEMANALLPFADAFILENVDPIHKTLLQLMQDVKKPIFLAIPTDHIPSLPLAEIQSTFAGIVLDEGTNQPETVINQSHLKAIKFLKKHHFSLPIVTVGGVSGPSHALSLLNEGADLIILSQGYVFSGPGLPKRIKEAQLDEMDLESEVSKKGWGWYWLFGFSIFIGGLIALFLSMTTIILPYDESFLNMRKEAISLFNERILYFMAHDRMTLAGTMVSGGIIYMFLARYGIRRGILWTKQATDTAAIIGFLGIFLFIGYGYFDWLHLLFWLILLPFYLIGFIKTRNLKEAPSSKNRTNHRFWKLSLYGQFSFVVLGFSFVIGGIVISYIGITTTFVATDLLYLCMPQEMLDEFNERLIPVIAHDRAGFGSALLSVGLLVLMVSLWGFQQGSKWVWWTLLLGGLPAFISGIAIHFAIGYTTFIHLLPAYFALFLYLVGLSLSYRYFHLEKY